MSASGRYAFAVRSYECGAAGVVTLFALMNYLQEAASCNAEELGFSKVNFASAGANISWVLTHLVVNITRYPRWGETLEVVTWPCGGRKIVAERDFELYIAGEKVGAATSAWMLIDLSTRHIVPVPQRVFDLADMSRPRAIPNAAFAKLRWDCRTLTDGALTFRAKRGDIDLNGHVNNAHYVAWLAEALPEGRLVQGLEIVFKSETLAGDAVKAESVEIEPNVFVARVTSPEGKDHVLARFVLCAPVS